MKTMEIKLSVSEERYTQIEQLLLEKGFTISDTADFILQERQKGTAFLNAIQNGEVCRIRTEEIIFIESFGKSIVLHTMDGEYELSERLKELEVMLDAERFMRISNSVIIAKNSVAKIKPTFSMKFILTLKNGTQVDVTRSYYYKFREAYGI
ncbi:MAG: LytTR family transcriptional regulator [Ruminococcus sp.]|nr:LytTR family transcriptional regulator [Ruminococcus sp.]